MYFRSLMAAALVLGIFVASPALAASQTAQSGSPGIALQGADTYRFQIGDVRIAALSDGTVPQDLHELLRGTTNANTDELLSRAYLSNPIEASINAFVLEVGNRVVLVDTGSGELFGPGYGGKLLDSLQEAGFRPEQVTDILVTHVHTDHTGGLVRSGETTFPNAIVHVGKPDVDFFLDRQNAKRTGYDIKYFHEAIKTLKPYLDNGKVQTFDHTTEVLPGITANLHPGHTPGSAFYTLESRGRKIVFVGDIIHVASVQFPDPSITIIYDVDPEKAGKAREDAFARFATEGDLIAAPHLPFPGVGHIRTQRGGYTWVPVNYKNRKAD